MRKRWIIVCVVLMMISTLAVSCGIPQEEYDTVVAERDSAQTELQSLKDELAASQASVSELTSSLDKATTELQDAKEHMSSAKSKAEIVNALFVPALNGELYEMSESEMISYFLEWRDKVVSSEDPVLLAKFDALMDSAFMDEQQMVDFFVYLFESIPETLE